MFNAALASNLSDNLAFGGKVTLIGVLVVFLLLGLIVLILLLSDFINKKLANKPKKDKKNDKNEGEQPNDLSPAPCVSAGNDVNNIDAATVAAIIGAINLVLASEAADGDPDARFIVRKIKKLNFRR